MDLPCRCGECDLHDKHGERLQCFSHETLQLIIADLACSHPQAGLLLRNKWLTEPRDIVATVSSEYDKRTCKALDFRKEKEADAWQWGLYYAVLAPLENFPCEQLEQAEKFIISLFEDEERLWDIIGIGEVWIWNSALHDSWLQVVLKKANGHPEVLRESINSIRQARIGYKINFRVDFLKDRMLRDVFLEYCA
jgi:hypothetical protein